MTSRTVGIRLFAALLLFVTLAGATAQVSAQDSGEGVSTTDLLSAYVSVSCSSDAGTTSCSFTPVDTSAESLFIPDSFLCSTVISTSASFVEGGLYQELSGGGIFVQLDGIVSASGGATYVLSQAGLSSDTAGDGLACSSTGDVGSGDETVNEEVTEEPTSEPETGEVTPEASPIVEVTPDAGEGIGNIDGQAPRDGEVVSETQSEVQVAPVADVTVGAVVYNCTTDPAGADPGTVGTCTLASGVTISVAVGGTPTGSDSTSGSGTVSFLVPGGSALVFTEDTSTLATGFQPLYGSDAYLTASEGASVTFVNITETIAGRLQIVNGSCPTSGESRTEFRVIEPRSVAAASTLSCSATGGTIFQIYGGSLGPDGISVVTGSDGAWRGYLPPAIYTVVDDSEESADVTVIADDVSLVIVVDYISAPLGVLNVSRFDCTDESNSGVEISFSGQQPDEASDTDCEASDGDITIEVQAEVSTASMMAFSLGSDGVAEVELPSGSYILTDDFTGEQAAFTLDAGTRVFASIADIALSDDGVGPGGGNGGDGDGDGTGNPGGGDGSGGGNNGGGDGTGSPDGGDGSGNGNNGGTGTGDGDGSTSGGVDAGTTEDLSDDAEIAAVNALPAAGVAAPVRQPGVDLGLFSLIAITLALGAVATRRRFGRDPR